MAGRKGREILLIAIHVHHSVGGDRLWIAIRKDLLAGWRIDVWQLLRRDLKAVSNFTALHCVDAGINDKRS